MNKQFFKPFFPNAEKINHITKVRLMKNKSHSNAFSELEIGLQWLEGQEESDVVHHSATCAPYLLSL